MFARYLERVTPNLDVDGHRTEQAIREAWEQGDHRTAVTLILDAYGRETLGYLRATSRTALAEDIYAQAALDLWEGIADFRWRCTARTFFFSVARHALARHHKLSTRARKREHSFAQLAWLDEAVGLETRTPTPAHLRSEVKARVRELRERLSRDDQTLLILRIDRKMSFKDLVYVMSDTEISNAEDMAMFAARLRKRFQSAKQRLRAMMVDDGLL